MDVMRVKNDKMIKEINDYVLGLVKDNEKLKSRLAEYSKDEEVSQLKKEIQNLRMNSIAILSDSQKEKVESFSDKHYISCKCHIDYIVTGTGIGDAIEIECRKCKEREDITDFDNW